jgi:hypothetical protein
MTTRRALLPSAALAPLFASSPRPTRAQVATPKAQALPDLAGVTPLPLTEDRLATFEAYIATALAEAGVPGAAVAVVQDSGGFQKVWVNSGSGQMQSEQAAPPGARDGIAA